MQYVLLLPILYLAAALETSLGGVVRVGRATPDLLALVAVVWLLTVGGPRGFLVAGAIGLVGDLIAPGRVGLGMASFLLVGYALSRLRTKTRSVSPRFRSSTRSHRIRPPVCDGATPWPL